MKKKILFFATFILCLSAQAQNTALSPTCFDISGLQVTIKQSDKFSVYFDGSSMKTKNIETVRSGDTLRIAVIDQTGPVPKGNITINTSHINYLSVHNGKLVCPETIKTDAMYINITSASGELKVKANELEANVDAGGWLKVKGNVDLFKGSTIGYGKLDTKGLKVKYAE